MQAKDTRPPAAHPEPPRQRLTSPWTLLGIGLAVGVTLILIFPGRGLLTTTSTQQKPDAVSLTYLDNMARKEPNNPELRFTLAQKQTELGKLAEARAALEPLYNSPDPAVRQRARLSDFKLQMQQMQALPAGSQERAKETERLRQELVAMTQYEWDVSGLLDLADVANRLEARKLRADLYLRIARSDNKVSRAWIDEVAQKALADSQYAAAAEIYFSAQGRSTSPEDQRYYFMQAIKAYQAGNMPREGLAAAEQHAGAMLNDDEILHFMIGLARAANDMKRAQAYAKRLMRMSEERVLMRWARAALSFAIPSATAAEREAAPRGKPPAGMRAYDAEDYQLAYEVFLAAGNQQDAYRVARSAVQQVPNDMRWRERLAQVSEWSGRHGESLEQWLFIARKTNSPAAWNSVLRIAPGMMNDEALLEAMKYQAGKAPLNEAQWRAVASAYQRVGRNPEAIEILEKEYARKPDPAILEQIAYLQELTGDFDGAIRSYRRLVDRNDASTEQVTTLATLYIRRGNYREAYDLLERYRAKAPAQDAEYLRLVGDLALRLRDENRAQATYEQLVNLPTANADDFTRLIGLLQQRQPEAAARLAEVGYERFQQPHFLLAALGIYSQRRDWGSMRRVFARMSPEVERSLEDNPSFLLLRAEYRANTGSPLLGLADFREALRLDPQNRFARMGLVYLLIDLRQRAALREELPLLTELAQQDPDFNGVVGSAWLLLDEPARALPYFADQVKRNPDDYLWLLNYADALDRNLERDFAWRVRRHAWFKLRADVEKKRLTPREILQAEARLASQFMSADEGVVVMRNLMRLDSDLDKISDDPRQQSLDAATRELVLAWTISTEQYITAKAWLWKQYARNLSAPAWAEINIALAHGHQELDTLQRALERYPDDIPRYDRHEAARRTQQYRLAQDIAFTELDRYAYDDEMHLRLTASTLDMASYSEAGFTKFTRGTIQGHEWLGEMAVWLNPRLRLSFGVSDIHQGLKNNADLGFVPGTDRLFGITALWRHAIGAETRFTLFHREALSDTAGFRLNHTHPLGTRVNGTFGLAYQDRTFETSGLAAGGMRDQVTVGLQYTVSKREYILGQLYRNRYYTQTERTEIGSSYGLQWEAGHRFRTEYPDWHVRVAGSFNHFSRDGSGDFGTAILTPTGEIPSSAFFLPESFNNIGLFTGFGTYYQTNYTRALRPFVDVGVIQNSVTGFGYGALVGASASLMGADRLTLYGSIGRGRGGTSDITRELGVRYQYLFDHF